MKKLKKIKETTKGWLKEHCTEVKVFAGIAAGAVIGAISRKTGFQTGYLKALEDYEREERKHSCSAKIKSPGLTPKDFVSAECIRKTIEAGNGDLLKREVDEIQLWFKD